MNDFDAWDAEVEDFIAAQQPCAHPPDAVEASRGRIICRECNRYLDAGA